ncbi:hypothetical protein BJ508DRAFT_414931 [Ascobolus immersus RN42]|uniref:Uncharacterized protein n=1 Tax=Ascobolus immersus RN42 TaxID=1160509 RepID=A0A3N4IAR6_ASCIM|nr:hypothetical protein BJ508DRAFT_414931 [Ascobolus immersus RN42]
MRQKFATPHRGTSTPANLPVFYVVSVDSFCGNDPQPNSSMNCELYSNLEQANASARQCALFGSKKRNFIPSPDQIANGEASTTKTGSDSGNHWFDRDCEITSTETSFDDDGCLQFTAVFKGDRQLGWKQRRVVSYVQKMHLSDTAKPITDIIAANRSRYMPSSMPPVHPKRKVSPLDLSSLPQNPQKRIREDFSRSPHPERHVFCPVKQEDTPQPQAHPGATANESASVSSQQINGHTSCPVSSTVSSVSLLPAADFNLPALPSNPDTKQDVTSQSSDRCMQVQKAENPELQVEKNYDSLKGCFVDSFNTLVGRIEAQRRSLAVKESRLLEAEKAFEGRRKELEGQIVEWKGKYEGLVRILQGALPV